MISTDARPVRYRIVIPLDRSEYAELVLEHALDQAVRHDDPDLHFLTVVSDRGDDPKEAQRQLAGVVLDGLETFRGDRAWRSFLHVRDGEPAAEIANLAAEVAADLVVIGRFGGHRTPLAERLIHRVNCPILVVGLSGHALASERPCPACAALREESDGTRWFCAAHASPGRLRLTELLPSSASGSHGGPLL
jgi:nucleotide-binding universal stress UspA family protein